MRYFNNDPAVEIKEDKTPVTRADVAANRYIVKCLKGINLNIPVISEEGDNLKAKDVREGYFWLVDPLDGTKGFIKGRPEFTVNIGLIKDRQPVLGIIDIPAQGTCYYGRVNKGAFEIGEDGERRRIKCRAPSQEKGLDAVISFSHIDPKTEAFLSQFRIAGRTSAASSLKFCVVARGDADVYPRFGRTMEWDTAAGHAILKAAGGSVLTPEGEEFLYAKDGLENGPFVGWGIPEA